MLASFEQLPGTARLWVYQANRALTPAQNDHLADELKKFCEQWEAHGQPLKTSFTIQFNRFAILAVDVDYNDASGCSIDGSVRVLKSFQQETGIDFFDRTHVSFVEGKEARMFPLANLKKLFADGTLGPKSQMIDTLVATKDEFKKAWIKTADDSWLKKYLPKNVVAGS